MLLYQECEVANIERMIMTLSYLHKVFSPSPDFQQTVALIGEGGFDAPATDDFISE